MNELWFLAFYKRLMYVCYGYGFFKALFMFNNRSHGSVRQTASVLSQDYEEKLI